MSTAPFVSLLLRSHSMVEVAPSACATDPASIYQSIQRGNAAAFYSWLEAGLSRSSGLLAGTRIKCYCPVFYLDLPRVLKCCFSVTAFTQVSLVGKAWSQDSSLCLLLILPLNSLLHLHSRLEQRWNVLLVAMGKDDSRGQPSCGGPVSPQALQVWTVIWFSSGLSRCGSGAADSSNISFQHLKQIHASTVGELSSSGEGGKWDFRRRKCGWEESVGPWDRRATGRMGRFEGEWVCGVQLWWGSEWETAT